MTDVAYDDKIMSELLNEVGVAENVEKMTKDEVEMFKALLVRTGVYAQYLYDKNVEKLKEGIK